MTEAQVMENVGDCLGSIAGIVTFLGAWAYCASAYGFLFGFGLGWIPAAILAVIVGLLMRWLWPLAVIAVVGLIVLMIHG